MGSGGTRDETWQRQQQMDGSNLWNSPRHPVGAGIRSANVHVRCVGTLLASTVCRTPSLEFHIKRARRFSSVIKSSTGGMHGRKSELRRDFVQRTNTRVHVEDTDDRAHDRGFGQEEL